MCVCVCLCLCLCVCVCVMCVCDDEEGERRYGGAARPCDRSRSGTTSNMFHLLFVHYMSLLITGG